MSLYLSKQKQKQKSLSLTKCISILKGLYVSQGCFFEIKFPRNQISCVYTRCAYVSNDTIVGFF